MIGTLEARLEEAIGDVEMTRAMLRGIKEFERYKTSLPAIPFSYTRSLLKKSPDFELVAMHWAPGSVSELHDHGNSRCWVAVIEGAIEVESFDRRDNGSERADLAFASSLHLTAGDTDHRLTWRELHRVRNTAAVSAYSLQIYAPVLTQYHVFDSTSGLYTTALARYESVLDL